MQIEQITEWIAQYGYLALFFCLWLGIVGMPIPDEVVVMTGGVVSFLDILQPIPSFFITYLGVISGLSLGYIVGRMWGSRLYLYLLRKARFAHHLKRSESLLSRYGGFALCISYFLPVVRHLLPYLVGSYRMPYAQYAIYSYTTGLLWTGIYFAIGFTVHDAIQKVADLSYRWGFIALIILIIGLITFIFYKKRKKVASSSETTP